MYILYYISNLHCIAHFVSIDYPHGGCHNRWFIAGRSPHLGILSGENMVTTDLPFSVDPGQSAWARKAT